MRHSGDGWELAQILCMYDLRKVDLFILSWARVQRVRRASVSSEPIMCGIGVRSILLLPLVARYVKIIDVCIWRLFVFIFVVVTAWGFVGMFVVYRAYDVPLVSKVLMCMHFYKSARTIVKSARTI